MKLIFCMQINIKVSYKLISKLWVKKFPTRWYYHYSWAWSNVLIVLKVTSLQCLYNISENKLGMEFIFLRVDKHQSFYKLALSFLIKVARHVHGTQNRKLVIFLQYINKKASQLLLCSIVMQNIRIFYGGPVMFVVT